jgi:hypothetical protein
MRAPPNPARNWPGSMPAKVTRPPCELICTIAPLRCWRMCGGTAWVRATAPKNTVATEAA